VHVDEPRLVVVRHIRDRDDIDVRAMAPVQWTVPAGAPCDLGDLHTADVDDVHVDRGPSHAVVLGEDEAAEAVQVT